LSWEKPDLPVQPFRGILPTNLVNLVRHRPSVMIDADQASPSERYKAAGYIGRPADPILNELDIVYPGSGYYLAHSADGLHWTEYPTEEPMGTQFDVGNFVRDEKRGLYLGVVKQHARYDLLDRRSIAWTTSRDFHAWTEPKLILVADALDDRMARDRGYHHAEFYGMGLAPYEDFLVGFLWVFWVYTPLLPGIWRRMGWWGEIDVQLVYSYDGQYWHRTPDRQPFIELGVHGEFDAFQIQTLGRPVITDDRVWIYYTGNNKTHAYFDPITARFTGDGRGDTDWDDPKMRHTRAIGVATIERDRYASFSTSTQGGFTVAHGPLDGEQLLVNARAPHGCVAVQVLDAEASPIEGFGLEACQGFTGDSLDGEITWAGGSLADLPADREICLRFALDNADVFAYELARS
jgi:hypothetical protein